MLASLEEKLDRRWTTLLIVDAQNDFLHQDGASGAVGMPVGRLRKALPALRQLVDAARACGVKIIFIKSVYTTDDKRYLTDQWLEPVRRRGDPRYTVVPVCEEGSWGAEFVSELQPRPGESIVEKHRFSAFFETDLDMCLKALRQRTLLVAGVVTNVCVESTIRDAFFRDYYCCVAREAVAAWDDSAHEESLRGINRNFGEVVSLRSVLRLWRRAPEPTVAARRRMAGT